MIIELKKFGDILTSRDAGREALLAFSPTLPPVNGDEKITIDFQGVSVLTPSWADEFIRPILERYTQRVSLLHATNPSVEAALRFAREPNLDLGTVTVFKDVLVFDEIIDEKMYALGKAIWTPTYPYSDEAALRMLKNNEIKKISVHPADAISDARLQAVITMLNQAGIETRATK